MTEETQEQEKKKDEMEDFSDAQQAFIDKLMGRTRIEARERTLKAAKEAQDKVAEDAETARMTADKEWQKLADRAAARVKELEKYEVEAKAGRELYAAMLKDRLKELGEGAKNAVAHLKTDLEKLAWLNANEELFATDTLRVGTPAARTKKKAGKSERPKGYVRSRL